MKKKGCSFLKKRTKKLLPIKTRGGCNSRRLICKSFLLLFFKKEELPFEYLFT
jgi:hypothetical protein